MIQTSVEPGGHREGPAAAYLGVAEPGIRGAIRGAIARFVEGSPVLDASGPRTEEAAVDVGVGLTPRARMGRAPHVILVDDHADTREAYAEYLRLEGFEVFEFEAAEEALEAAEKRPPDVFVVDYTLPRMNGVEAARRLRADPKTADVAVLFVSGHTSIEEDVRNLTAPPNVASRSGTSVLRKPVAPDALVTALFRLSTRV